MQQLRWRQLYEMGTVHLTLGADCITMLLSAGLQQGSGLLPLFRQQQLLAPCLMSI